MTDPRGKIPPDWKKKGTVAWDDVRIRHMEEMEFKLKEYERAIRVPVNAVMVDLPGMEGCMGIIVKCDGPLPVLPGMELLVLLPEDGS